MIKKVLKFGGTSVGSIDRIKHVADIIRKERKDGNQIIAVVSAMSGVTNNLIDLVKSLSHDASSEEYDVALSSGEQVTSALLTIALNNLKIKGRSWLGWQVPIITDNNYSKSGII